VLHRRLGLLYRRAAGNEVRAVVLHRRIVDRYGATSLNASRSFYTSGPYVEHYLGMRWPTRLWGAVLTNAIDDVIAGPRVFETKGMTPEDALVFARDIRQAAEDWIADEANEPRRFRWVCEQLSLDPDAVRRSVNERRQA
jgi:hypothetical protein